MDINLNQTPLSGEIGAISGYYEQYKIAAYEIYSSLSTDSLEWVELASQRAGNLDDVLIGLNDSVLAFQIKYKSGVFSYNSLTNDDDKLIHKMFEGWKNLNQAYTNKRIDVRLITTQEPSENDKIVLYASKTKPSFTTFIKNFWKKIQKGEAISIAWKGVQDDLCAKLKCSTDELHEFIGDTQLSFNYPFPKKAEFNLFYWRKLQEEINKIQDFIFRTIGKEKKTVHLTVDEFKERIGLKYRLQTHFHHEFLVDEAHYQPIIETLSNLVKLTLERKQGYISLIGSAGSGKSTLLTKWLNESEGNVLKYYAYVNRDMNYEAGYRGEAKFFLHDIIMQIRHQKLNNQEILPSNDRLELKTHFTQELIKFSETYKRTGKKTFILVDGLDHIDREQQVEYSLLKDLPDPNSIPEGVFFILGTRTIIGLKDLPINIRLNIMSEERLVEIQPLDKNAVSTILKSYKGLPLISNQFDKIFINTHGHPLFLRYTIEKLLNSSPEGFDKIIEQQEFSGNVIDEYQKFWYLVQGNDELINLLAIVARFRFSFIEISILENDFRFSSSALNDFLVLAGHFFNKVEVDKWQYFHNSFKWFLEEQTSKSILTGKHNPKKDEEVHQLIADKIKASISSYKWNLIYHLFKSKQYDDILLLSSQEYFRTQWFQFRNYKHIGEDISIFSRASYYKNELSPLFRSIICISELNQRVYEFDPSEHYDLYVALGREDIANTYILEGKSLLVNKEKALDYSGLLFRKGNITLAKQIYSLAEPAFILHHSKEVDENRYSSETFTSVNEFDLIVKWSSIAINYYPLDYIIELIKPLRVVSRHDYGEERRDQESLNLNLLIHSLDAIVDVCIEDERWDIALDGLNHIYSRIQSHPFLLNILYGLFIDKPYKSALILSSFNERLQDWKAKNNKDKLQLCFIYSFVLKNNEKAKSLFNEIQTPRQLQDKGNFKEKFYYFNDYITLYSSINSISKSDCSVFEPESDNDDEYQAFKYISELAFYHSLPKESLRLHISNIHSLIQSILYFYHRNHTEMEYSVRDLKEYILKTAITLCKSYGEELFTLALDVISADWLKNKQYWRTNEIRSLIDYVAEDKSKWDWCATRLASLENIMLKYSYKRERAEECIKQARSWLKIEKPHQTELNLKNAFKQSFGIRGEDDYQLDKLIDWLKIINEIDPSNTTKRIQWILDRIEYIQETTSHAHSTPALKLLRITFEWNKKQGIDLLKWLLVNKIVEFTEAIEEVLEFLLSVEDSNTFLYLKIYTRVILFFQDSGNAGLGIVALLAEKEFSTEFVNKFINEVDTYAIQEYRYEVLKELDNKLKKYRTEVNINLDIYNTGRQNSSQTTSSTLRLESGEEIDLQEILNRTKNYNDILELIQKESTNSYFNWLELLKNKSEILTSEEIRDITLRKYKSEPTRIADAGEIILSKGNIPLAKELAYLALSQSRADGWVRYYDGGSKIKSYTLLSKVETLEIVSDLIFKDLAFSLSKIDAKVVFENIEPIIRLMTNKPPFEDLYSEVDKYQFELFSNAKEIENKFVFKEGDYTLSETTANLLLFLYEFPISTLKEHIEKIIIEENSNSEVIADSFLDYLIQNNHFEATLNILNGIYLKERHLSEKRLIILKQLTHNDRFDISYFSLELFHSTGFFYLPEIQPKELPLIYKLKLEHKPELIISDEERIRRIEETRKLRDTNDPVEYIGFYKRHAEVIADESGIPLINIAHRIMDLSLKADSIGWFDNFDEEQIINLFKSLDLNSPYIRPRNLRIWPSLMKVVSELLDNDYLSIGTAFSLSKKNDPRISLIETSKRPEFIKKLNDDSLESFIHSRHNEKWVEEMKSECFENFVFRTENKFIIAEFSHLLSYVDGRPTEIKQSYLSTNPAINARYYIYDSTLYNILIEAYPELRRKEITFYNHNHTSDNRMEWLAINPKICYELGWSLAEEGNFRWLNENGEIMIESVYWIDGNIENHERFLYSEAGFGWCIIASTEAMKELLNHVKEPIYLHQSCKRKYRYLHRRHNKDIDVEKTLTNSIPINLSFT